MDPVSKELQRAVTAIERNALQCQCPPDYQDYFLAELGNIAPGMTDDEWLVMIYHLLALKPYRGKLTLAAEPYPRPPAVIAAVWHAVRMGFTGDNHSEMSRRFSITERSVYIALAQKGQSEPSA